MLRTRSELDQAVFQLYAAVPLWRRECGSEPALRARYRRLFDDVLDSASDEDFDYVVYQLGELAVSTGVFSASPFGGMREDACSDPRGPVRENKKTPEISRISGV